jgi:hypothetical protein
MSLINEALKRTRDATYQGAARPSDLTGYRYEGGQQKISSSPRAWLVVAALGCVAAIALGFLFSKHAEPPPAPAPVVVAAAPAPKPVDEALVAQVVEKLKAEQAVTPAPTQAVVVATPPPVPEPEPPKLKLQGTTVHAGLKEAMINNQNLRVGDEIEGARVTEIENRRVKLDWRGRELSLRMQ